MATNGEDNDIETKFSFDPSIHPETYMSTATDLAAATGTVTVAATTTDLAAATTTAVAKATTTALALTNAIQLFSIWLLRHLVVCVVARCRCLHRCPSSGWWRHHLHRRPSSASTASCRGVILPCRLHCGATSLSSSLPIVWVKALSCALSSVGHCPHH